MTDAAETWWDEIEIFDADGALSAEYLLARGYCCGNGCRNCPYVPRHGGVDALPPEGVPIPGRGLS